MKRGILVGIVSSLFLSYGENETFSKEKKNVAIVEDLDTIVICASKSNSYPVSRGNINHGSLRNPSEINTNLYVTVNRPQNKYGTPELINTLVSAAGNIYEKYGTKLEVHDLSKKNGGKLGKHLSHQNGLDADVGIYYWNKEKNIYENQIKPFQKYDDLSMDINWNFIKILQQQYPIEYILWNHGNKMKQFVLKKYGTEEWNEYGKVIKYWKGHYDHYHIRIKKPQPELDYEKEIVNNLIIKELN